MENNMFNRFDKVVLLTLSNRPDKFKHMQNMFSDLNICMDGIHVHTATPFPYNRLIAEAFNKASNRRCFTKANEYDCARNHYSIIKQAYDEGCNNVLIFEDDVCLLKDKQLLSTYMENIPDDYDIIQFSAFSNNPSIKTDILGKRNEHFYVKHPNILLWCADMYALSRKGMEYYLNFMNKWFTVADMPIYKAPLNSHIINVYVSTIPLAIQADKDIMSSDIRDKANDKINYNTENVYESALPKTDYYDI